MGGREDTATANLNKNLIQRIQIVLIRASIIIKRGRTAWQNTMLADGQ